MSEQRWLHCSSWWGRMPLSEHEYCMAVSFKMTEWVEPRICIRFCVKPEHFSAETTRMIQKDTAMGNWWLAASSWQQAHSCITSPAELFGETSNHPGDYPQPHSPDLVPCDFWLFPKLKSPLKGKSFLIISEIQENTTGSRQWLGELCEVLLGTTLPGFRSCNHG